MAEQGHRSYLREASGPRPVENARDKHRGSGRRHKEADDRDKQRSRKTEMPRSHRKESGHRKKASAQQSCTPAPERPRIELDVIGQPASGIQLGMPVEKSVMISLKLPSPEHAEKASCINTSSLFALTSLVSDSSNGERVPQEPNALCGMKTLDSIHPIPEHVVDNLARNYPLRQALGYFSFPGMVIRQAGTYRIRTTLVRMGEAGANSLLAVDSEPIKVERSGVNSQRRRQQVYG
ncbi:uncharacterized protein LTR77_005168 [Saxophila tyrrhenica]|uniref:Velvet domain-containing protein n=1 Tax=Saxophila tyrrhenica TaxID=1690608 RepID=A0AAV9PFI0_9PEZI|nr:hypothetical protein LTR77_005168 [Saxophila tyrrhenica]